MQKIIFGFLICCLLLGMLSASAHATRAVWIWDKDRYVNTILKSSSEQDKLFKFAASPHGTRAKIDTFYLEAYRYFAKDAARLAAFIGKAGSKGIKVYFLDGDPSWAVAYQEEALARVRMVQGFNRVYRNSAFSGVVFDIEPYLLVSADLSASGNDIPLEPYLLPQWKTKRAEVEKKYLELLAKIKALMGRTEFGVAVPVLFSESSGGPPSLAERILDIADFVVVMDYRDVALRIIRDGMPFVEAAGQRGKRAIIGIETIDLSSIGEGNNASTFAEEGVRVMEGELAKVQRVLGNKKGYGGIAIHYYNSYRGLQMADRNRPLANVPEITAMKVTPFTIDGDPAKWDHIPFYSVNKKENVIYQAERMWGGEKDISGAFAFVWAPGKIYLGLKVKDNVLVVTPGVRGMDIWKEDHIEFWAAPDLAQPGSLKKDYQLGFSPGNFNGVAPFVASWVPEYLRDKDLAPIEVAARHTKDGYFLEAMIPTKVFGGFTPESGDKIRMSVDFSDTDIPAALQELLLSPTERVWGKSGTFSELEFE